MAVELSFSPWADEMILTLVGGGDRLPEALGKHNVLRTDDLDGLLDRLEHRAAMQREHRRYPVLSQHRIDPDLADPWAPEIVLVEQALSAAQRARLRALDRRRAQGLTLGGRRGGAGCRCCLVDAGRWFIS